MIVFLLLMCITFSMSMLSFIEDNKRNEHGGEFSRKLRIFQNFCISSFSILMEDHLSDQATAGDGPDGARALPRRSSRVDDQDPGFKYTA